VRDDVLYANFKMQGAAGVKIRDGVLLCCERTREVLSIPIGIVSLADGCLSGNNIIKKVFVPYTVESVGTGVFSNCQALRNIVIPQCLWLYTDKIRSGTNALVTVSASRYFTTLDSEERWCTLEVNA